MNSSVKKIFIVTYPFVGHTNPILAICNDLKNKNYDITIYSKKNFKELIEKAGARFREYNFEFKNRADEPDLAENIQLMRLACLSIDKAAVFSNQLLEDALNEKPDMIMYDKSTIYARLVVEYLLNEYRKRGLKPFKLIRFSTTFVFDREYPNAQEKKLFKMKILPLVFYLIWFMIKKFLFYFTHGIYNKSCGYWSTSDPLENETTMVFTFPQLQPRSELRDKNKFKFVGSCLDQELHLSGRELHCESFKIVDRFPIRINTYLTQFEYELIYVAFGSVLTNQANLYLKIINGLKLVNEIKPIKVIISTGNKCYEYLTSGQFEIPEFVYLARSMPQIDVLKRASLFITHNGMNSTSESLHFGVPMICMPMTTDQPLVAYRVADELKLGIKLDYKSFNAIQLRDAVLEILNDRSYYDRCKVFMNYSQYHNGIQNSAKLINYLLRS